MKASEALQLSQSKMPSIIDKEYDDIMKKIKLASENGETKIYLFDMPNGIVAEKLRRDGYEFYSTGSDHDCFMPFMDMRIISWRKRIIKKKWYQKIF